MKLTLYIPNLSIYLLALTLFISCKETPSLKSDDKTEAFDELGQISLNVSGSKEAQKQFKTGLLLLHSFEYDDARVAFQDAQTLDSTMVMAYWGEAMTYNHSLWQRQEKEDALAVLNNLANSPDQRIILAKTDLEKDFIKAVDILYGEGTKYERDIAYEKFMQKLTKKYPDNNEVSAFHAISLLAASRNGRDDELYSKSAMIAQGIIKENPNHPGALHYLIHAFDDPGHAHLAKSAADAYSKVAPDATHALHMPSHIYVALGQWNDVINSNIASWNASVKKESKSYHALHWLQYGFLQRGEYDNAKSMLDKVIELNKADSTKVARGYLNNMLGGYLVATNEWSNKSLEINYKTDDLNLTTRTSNNYINGMRAYHRKDIKSLKSYIAQMSKDIYSASLSLGDNSFAMCSAGGFANKPPNQLDIDMSSLMEDQLTAKMALLQKEPQRAIEILKKACKLDESLSYSYGPPIVFKPVNEDLAEILMTQKKSTDAIEVFKKSLKRNPKRIKSLQGLSACANSTNDEKTLNDISKDLAELSLIPNRKTIL